MVFIAFIGALWCWPVWADEPGHSVDEGTGKLELRAHGGAAGKRGGAREEQLQRLFDDDEGDEALPWWRRDNLSGGWGGARRWLTKGGLELVPSVVGEWSRDFAGRGAGAHGGRYLTELMMVLSGDAWGWSGLRLVGIGHLIGGRSLSAGPVGDAQVYSNIDAGTRRQWSELWLEQRLASDTFRLKLGQFDANVDFAALEYAAELLNSSFGLPPTIGLPTYPDPGWGGVLIWQPNKVLQVDVGWVEGAANGRSLRLQPTSLSDLGVLLAEVTLHTGPLLGRAGGSIHLGAWSQPLASQRPGGLWLMAEEPLWQRSGHVVALFAQGSWRWSAPSSAIRWSLGGGVIAQGMIPLRPDDVVSMGVTSVAVGGGQETATEWMYKVAVMGSTMWVLDLQYIHGVGGVDEVSAWIGSTRLSVQL